MDFLIHPSIFFFNSGNGQIETLTRTTDETWEIGRLTPQSQITNTQRCGKWLPKESRNVLPDTLSTAETYLNTHRYMYMLYRFPRKLLCG